ncbi:hypothetical protein [Paenibacillus apiarius]|uniref:hypothetical protein n=1 Tax=Paenibacillus apiarius TaxID=46240 RepID=UPI003B3A45BD
MDKRQIFGVPVDGQSVHSFKRADLLFVQNWKKSNKVDIPMFYTKKGRYTVCTSLEIADAGMPTFEHFQRWNLVNKLAVDRIDHDQFGNIVRFKDTEITTSISDAKFETVDLQCINEERVIIVAKDERGQLYPLREVCYIDLAESKKGYKIPRLYTTDDVFLIGMTLGQCGEALELTHIDSGIYANIDNIEKIELSPYGAIVHFVGSEYTTTIAQRKARIFKKIIPTLKTL